MLKTTFRHLVGFGKKKEALLWEAGILTWADYQKNFDNQMNLFESFSSSPLAESETALVRQDADFFADRLPRQEHFRIALSFPEDTMFLDIETTGLSRYYDNITVIGWSLGCQFDVFIQGGDATKFLKAVSQAKAIVTFNGSIFDLPFIKKDFPDINFPPCHVDLRFLAKRAGFTGGQKAIEQTLGVKRSSKASEVDGEFAPVLWHRYKWGDKQALKQLIIYNHADVEGMKVIFDKVVRKIVKNYRLSLRSLDLPKFSQKKCKIKWSNNPEINEGGIYLPPYKGKAGPSVFLEDLPIPTNLNSKIVGIDLTGSEGKPSGWSLLDHDEAKTRCICTDDELISATLAANAGLVSIDSPLSIPAGRLTVTDDDPGRNEFGIMRYCERLLKKRGVNVYPSLIPSMQKLTARGMRLAQRFRELGVPVIESYPGAAQDIMGIPRKGASIEYLAKGLELFGIKGDYIHQKVTHDELDAITSAAVGLFFWSGKFEAIGNEEEDYLIIPDLDVDPASWLNRKVIGLSGPIASGKTTAGRFFESKGFTYGRFSQVIKNIVEKKGLEANRENLQAAGEEINKYKGQRWLGRELCKLLKDSENLVIDGLRHPEDHAFMIETFGASYHHVSIIAPLDIRRKRYIANESSENAFANAITHPVEQNVDKVAALADSVIENTSDLSSFKARLEKIIELKLGDHT